MLRAEFYTGCGWERFQNAASIFPRRKTSPVGRDPIVIIVQGESSGGLAQKMLLKEHRDLGLWGFFKWNRVCLSVCYMEPWSMWRFWDYLFRSRYPLPLRCDFIKQQCCGTMKEMAIIYITRYHYNINDGNEMTANFNQQWTSSFYNLQRNNNILIWVWVWGTE